LEITLHAEALAWFQPNLFLNFASTAYACDPVFPPPAAQVSAIAITARETFSYNSQEYAKDADVSTLFLVTTGRKLFNSVEEFVTSGFPSETYHQPQFYIRLKDAPETATLLPLSLQISSSNNKNFRFNQLEFRVK
jgi:hypothetical protein